MRPSGFVVLGLTGLLVCVSPRFAGAQQPTRVAAEVVTGHAGYVDEAWDNRIVIGGLLRLAVTRRLAVGPELVYLRGAGDEHEVLMTGTAIYDLRGPEALRRVVPFIVGGAGVARRSSRVGRGPGLPGLQVYASNEFTASGGIGVRVAVTRSVYLSGDARLGWEPERRLTVSAGWKR